MPLGDKKLVIYFPDDWEDNNIYKLRDSIEAIVLVSGTDGLVFEIEKVEKEKLD